MNDHIASDTGWVAIDGTPADGPHTWHFDPAHLTALIDLLIPTIDGRAKRLLAAYYQPAKNERARYRRVAAAADSLGLPRRRVSLIRRRAEQRLISQILEAYYLARDYGAQPHE